MKFTKFEMACWQNTYMCLEEVEDRHSMFASKLGIERQAAKELCYKIMWSVPFMKPMLEDLRDYSEEK